MSCNCFGGRRKKDPEFDGEDFDEDDVLALLHQQDCAAVSAKDETAALQLLNNYDFVDELEDEWPEADDGWMDRVIIGRIAREEPEQKNGMAMMKGALGFDEKKSLPNEVTAYMGFILLSMEAPFAYVNGGHVRQTAYEGELHWKKWGYSHADLKPDMLHLLPEATESERPIASLDLGTLTAVPTIEVWNKEQQECFLVLQFGAKTEKLLVVGELQALRWQAAIKAGMVSSMEWDTAEITAADVYKALQRFDSEDIDKLQEISDTEQHEMLEEFLMNDAQDCRDNLELFVDPEKLAPNVCFEEKINSLLVLEEEMLQTKLLLRLIKDLMLKPKIMIAAATRTEPVRTDMLDYWKTAYHQRTCKALEHIWHTRGKRMSITDVSNFAYALEDYRVFLQKNFIEDTSLTDGLTVVSACYTVKSKHVFTDLMAMVARRAELHVLKNGGIGTTAPMDVLCILGQATQLATTGPEELRYGAACVVADALNKYERENKRVFKMIQSARLPAALFAFCCAFLVDAARFGDSLEELAQVEDTGADGELGDDDEDTGDRGVLRAVAVRFHQASQVYVDKLVSMAMLTSGAAKAFGDPQPSVKGVLSSRYETYLEKVIEPMMYSFQGYLTEGCQSEFAEQFITRFVAFELFALLFSPPESKLDCGKVAAILKGHRSSLEAMWPHWVSRTDLHDEVKESTGTLQDVGLLLNAPLERIQTAMAAMVSQYPDFSQECAHRILLLRGIDAKSASEYLAKVPFPGISGDTKSVFGYLADTEWAAELVPACVARRSWSDEWMEKWEDEVKVIRTQLEDDAGKNDSNSKVKGSDDLDAFLEGVDSDDLDEIEEVQVNQEDIDNHVESHTDTKAKGTKESSSGAAGATYQDPRAAAAELPGGGRHSGDDDYNSDDDVSLVSSKEDDEFIIGYLYIDSSSDHTGLEGGGVGFMSGFMRSWRMRFFTVQQDMKGQRSLCWYRDQSDMVAKGMVMFSDFGEIRTSVSTEFAKAPYLIEIDVPAEVASGGKLALRTAFDTERDLWYERLILLQQRQKFSEITLVERTEVVYKLRRTLRLTNPMGCGGGGKKPANDAKIAGIIEGGRKSLQKAAARRSMVGTI
eukprot:TRINITY_DN14914_c0_g2_i1.p1 TRINITY_DN14914_c0_g2~~TRINITY_DN14914_c0_g2_i1.p1  ORF type:complete len:1099 (+),score=317.28 TRINITY_DN14914_c0_g2_i1:146-3442(+)